MEGYAFGYGHNCVDSDANDNGGDVRKSIAEAKGAYRLAKGHFYGHVAANRLADAIILQTARFDRTSICFFVSFFFSASCA